MYNKTNVSLVRCESYDKEKVALAVNNVFEHFGGIGNFIKKGSKVLIKPNLLKGCDPETSCTITNPAIIEGVTKKVLEFGATPIIGDSPAFGSVDKIAERAGFDKFARKYGVEIIELDAPKKVKAYCGKKLFTSTISSKALEVDAIINLPKLKAHTQFYYTAAVKNMYGCVSGKRKACRHLISNNNIDWFTEMLLANYNAVKPVFTIVDAVMAMERRGPSGGDSKQVSLIISGIDCIAIDRVAAEIININPAISPILKTAKLHGIGEQNLDEIEILGENLKSVLISDFKLPLLMPVGFGPIQVVKSFARHLWLKNFGKVA